MSRKNMVCNQLTDIIVGQRVRQPDNGIDPNHRFFPSTLVPISKPWTGPSEYSGGFVVTFQKKGNHWFFDAFA